MIEFLDMLVTNTHIDNRDILDTWAVLAIQCGWWVGIIIGCCYAVDWVWKFIDDKKVHIHKLVLVPIVSITLTIAALLVIVAITWLLVVVFAHTFYQVPLIWYGWVAGTCFSLLLARYARRTHKVIHGHIKDKKAHTVDADKDIEKLSNSLNKDPFFYNEEE